LRKQLCARRRLPRGRSSIWEYDAGVVGSRGPASVGWAEGARASGCTGGGGSLPRRQWPATSPAPRARCLRGLHAPAACAGRRVDLASATASQLSARDAARGPVPGAGGPAVRSLARTYFLVFLVAGTQCAATRLVWDFDSRCTHVGTSLAALHYLDFCFAGKSFSVCLGMGFFGIMSLRIWQKKRLLRCHCRALSVSWNSSWRCQSKLCLEVSS
jgi:hypothetical protein